MGRVTLGAAAVRAVRGVGPGPGFVARNPGPLPARPGTTLFNMPRRGYIGFRPDPGSREVIEKFARTETKGNLSEMLRLLIDEAVQARLVKARR